MKPVPPEVSARWLGVWGDVHPERPWWHHPSKDGGTYFPFDLFGRGPGPVPDPDKYVRRGGGVSVAANRQPEDRSRAPRISDPVVGWFVCVGDPTKVENYRCPEARPDGFETADAAMAWYDTAHPLPAPPPMCDQTWAWPDGEQLVVSRVFPGGEAMMACGGPFFAASEWPPPGAVLVAGPSPWGRDVPWSGA